MSSHLPAQCQMGIKAIACSRLLVHHKLYEHPGKIDKVLIQPSPGVSMETEKD